jgi:DNA polymerase/3'-5' exonuclease PolX
MEFKKRQTELLKSIEAAVERAHEEAVASGLPKERVVGLWAIMGLGPRKLDHALDYLPEEQVELVAGLKKSFDEVQQMRADGVGTAHRIAHSQTTTRIQKTTRRLSDRINVSPITQQFFIYLRVASDEPRNDGRFTVLRGKTKRTGMI